MHCDRARVNGNVDIGSNTFIGSGAIVKQGVSIGENTIIAAGQFIQNDLPGNSIVEFVMGSGIRAVAEVGVNHNGSIEQAERLIEVASNAGSDYVKFQCFNADLLATPDADLATYQEDSNRTVSSQIELLRQYELSRAIIFLERICLERGIEYLSSAFDLGSLNFLRDQGLKTFKVPSGKSPIFLIWRC